MPNTKVKPKCSVEGCDKPHVARGYCRTHYSRIMRTGHVNPTREFHNMCDTPIYRRWKHMRERCYDEKDKFYHRYGGRGITMCKEWRESFLSFYADMGDPPTNKHQIDRIDNNKGYFKDNCRWATNQENCQNRNNTRLTESDVRVIKFSSLSSRKLAENYGVSIIHVQQIRNGRKWSNITVNDSESKK